MEISTRFEEIGKLLDQVAEKANDLLNEIEKTIPQDLSPEMKKMYFRNWQLFVKSEIRSRLDERLNTNIRGVCKLESVIKNLYMIFFDLFHNLDELSQR